MQYYVDVFHNMRTKAMINEVLSLRFASTWVTQPESKLSYIKQPTGMSAMIFLAGQGHESLYLSTI